MSFLLGGAMMGAGNSIEKWADAKREEIAKAKEREANMADAKELFDYKLNAKAAAGGGSGGGKGGGKGGGRGKGDKADDGMTLNERERDFLLAQNGYSWEADAGNPAVLELITAAERIKGATNNNISDGELVKLVRDRAVRSDVRVPGKWGKPDTFDKGAGDVIGVSGFDSVIAPNPVGQGTAMGSGPSLTPNPNSFGGAAAIPASEYPSAQAPAAQAPAAPKPSSGPVKITSQAQRDALPAGTQYVAPDGTIRTKQ